MDKLKGIAFVSIGAASYGVLATIVKLANNAGFGTAALTFLQFVFGVIVLSIISFVSVRKNNLTATNNTISSNKSKFKLLLFGSSLGFTSCFYYLAIQFVPVSIGIILLMQTVWMSIILEFFTERERVNRTKLIGAIVVLAGTALASRIFESDFTFSPLGFGYGFLAALSYTITMYATNKISLDLPNITRSKYLVLGGFIAIIFFWNYQITEELNTLELIKWGVILGLFGTVLPPILFNNGVPKIGAGLAGILATLEIPVSILSAYFMLNERIGLLQALGILIILITIIKINTHKEKVI
ncbi:EamA family transporter [Leeuwenhoekiella aequorea]|uniref:Threonine/homoserine efflux transporter RhtA n=1 Tax=Leeuwenhoekiella aequorea TaxID=283736 RepID=A0A4Q0PCJ6_9FLAO|nr:DMT family transporter [Leeuwenhoekiella aequorea]RXG23729.1 threonine/homoserine efflux transporter RhtA [Leeuwenhoekiella aequorea]